MHSTQNKVIRYTLALAILGCFNTPGEAKTELVTETEAGPKVAVQSETPSQISIANANKKSFGYSNRYGAVTPSQVYSLQQDFEALFMLYVKNHKKGLAAQVKALNLVPITGKIPDDVFVITNRLSNSLDRLAKSLHLKPMKRFTREKAKAIPAEVYLQAGNNLDVLVKIMNKLESEKNWGNYYAIRQYKLAKNPSDVFALADLSERRLNLVLYGGNPN
ncbi:MAG TPA: hypothetical protein ENI80_02560 [Acidiferrobacteraceae bacterium]|nr:hypothetical protein [Acidiferrobacteraceae bacterium]